MKHTVHSKDVGAGQAAMRAPQPTGSSSHPLAQFAGLANQSPRMQGLAQLKNMVQISSNVQGLHGLAAEINPGLPGVVQGVFKKAGEFKTGGFKWVDTETGEVFKQVEIQVDDRIKLCSQAGGTFYIQSVGGEWNRVAVEVEPIEAAVEEEAEAEGEKEVPGTVAKIIRDVAEKCKINPSTSAGNILLSLMIETTEQELANLQVTGKLKEYLGNWAAFTACFNTADLLYGLLHQEDAQAEVSATQNDAVSIGNVCRQLCEAISVDNAISMIYRIKFGIHGFTILVRGGSAELLQSFAGEGSGESLATSVVADKRFSKPQIAESLTAALTSNKKPTRNAAQNTLFGGTIDEGKWPDVPFSWKSGKLLSHAEIIKAITNRIQANLKKLRKIQKDFW
jgi:hypothetical protein